jgi:pimeloyl-ACP methyl ester carboxylesterase
MSGELAVFKTAGARAQYYAAYSDVLSHWPVAYDEIYLPTRFGDTHVVASGPKDAPPLVLLHCWCGSATIWFRNVGPLSQHFRTYAVDVIGEPNKSIPTRIVSGRQEYANWILDLFEGLQIGSANLVGNSFGGFLAISTASYLPERVKKAVLISPAAVFEQIWAFYWHILLPCMLRSQYLIQKGAEWLLQGLQMDECVRKQFTIAMTAGVFRNRVFPSVFKDEELRNIRTPVLLLIGDREVLYDPMRVIRRATSLVEGLRAEIVPHAHHIAELIAPDLVNARILDFLL